MGTRSVPFCVLWIPSKPGLAYESGVRSRGITHRQHLSEEEERSVPMNAPAHLGGSFTLPGSDTSLRRMGYGAMQLAGPHVWGPPRDVDAALAVLREAVALGINHIDTADFYGPHVTNELIHQALAPYPDDLRIVTKVGAVRDDAGGWVHARSTGELRDQVHDNLRTLKLD